MLTKKTEKEIVLVDLQTELNALLVAIEKLNEQVTSLEEKEADATKVMEICPDQVKELEEKMRAYSELYDNWLFNIPTFVTWSSSYNVFIITSLLLLCFVLINHSYFTFLIETVAQLHYIRNCMRIKFQSAICNTTLIAMMWSSLY